MEAEFFRLMTSCGSLDAQFLSDLMMKYYIEPDEVFDGIEEMFGDKDSNPGPFLDFNAYVYSAFRIIEENIKDELIRIADEEGIDIERKISEYSPNIYTNYLDSFFDDTWFSEFADSGVNRENAISFFREELGYDEEDEEDESN